MNSFIIACLKIKSVTETKFLVSDFAGQPDLVKKQRERFWRRASFYHLNVRNTVKGITFCVGTQ